VFGVLWYANDSLMVERADVEAAGECLVRLRGALERRLAQGPDDGVQGWIECLDALERRVHHLDGRDGSIPNRSRDLRGRCKGAHDKSSQLLESAVCPWDKVKIADRRGGAADPAAP
jgi:hypothetical protein